MNVTTLPAPTPAATGRPRARVAAPMPWWKVEAKLLMKPRTMLMGLLLLTYVWRFHDLSGLIAPLRLAAIATVGSWLYLLSFQRFNHFLKMLTRPGVIAVILGVLWSGAMVPFALNPDIAWSTWWGTHFKTLTMFLFLLTCFTTFHNVKQAMAAHIFGAAVLAFFYAKGGFALWGSPVTMYDVNDMAMHLNMALPFVLFFAIRAPRGYLRIFLWCILALLTICALMTQSRGAFLTVGLLTGIILVSASGIKLWIRMLPPILVALGFAFSPPATKERLSTLFNPTEDYNVDDEAGRLEIWKRAYGYTMANPVTGVGITNFPVAEYVLAPQAQARQPGWRPKAAHNIFVEIGTETGFPGLLLFVTMLVAPLARLVRIRSRAKKHLRGTPLGDEVALAAEVLALSMLAYCVGGFFLSMAYAPVIYSVIAMVAGFDLCTSRIFPKRGAAGARRPTARYADRTLEVA